MILIDLFAVCADCEDNKSGAERCYLPHDPLEKDEVLVPDEGAYRMRHELNLKWPCLSFDLFPYDGSTAKEYPLEIYLAAGTQAIRGQQDYLCLLKCSNLGRTNFDDEDAEGPICRPKVKCQEIEVGGCINRVAVLPHPEARIVAAWCETGSVHVYNVSRELNCLEVDSSGPANAQAGDPLAIIDRAGIEGYALGWSEKSPGVLALGDSSGALAVASDLPVFDRRKLRTAEFRGHTGSVEDIQWSPTQGGVIASASADMTIRIWDIRAGPAAQLCIKAHDSDVNVIDWNKSSEHLIASGADSGEFRVWDIRTWQPGSRAAPPVPACEFGWHRKAVTSIEWMPGDPSVLAVSGEDDQISIWDLLAREDPDEPPAAADDPPGTAKIPTQLLFIHQGQKDIKEVHWHPRLGGVLLSTASDGINIFETISTGI